MIMLNFEKQFPNIDENMDAKEACKVLTNYVYQVMKYLRWALDNLDINNMSSDFTEQITGELEDGLDDKIGDIANSYFNNIISQNIVTNTLTAEYGNIARLTVDELRTDYKRAQNYLNGNKSDLDYIYIHDEEIIFITAVVSGDEGIPFVSGGKQLYWFDVNKNALTFESTETKVVNNKQVTVPREKAYVYPYTEYEKGHIKFEPVQNGDGTNTVQPVFVLGTGDGSGNGKAYILKNTDYAKLLYVSRLDGKAYGFLIGDDGIYQSTAGILTKMYPMAVVNDVTEADNLPVGTLVFVGAVGGD